MKYTFSVILVSLVAIVLFISCSDDLLPPKNYSTHIPGWIDASSANFHGTAVINDTLKYNGCAGCHGQTYQGMNGAPSCYECHAAYPHYTINPAHRVSTHRALIVSLNWQIGLCHTCHSGDNWEGSTGVACTQCHFHQSANGPGNCYTCHGQPPSPDSNNVLYGMDSLAAGGHQAMVVEKGYACIQCHPSVPEGDLTHMGPLPAVVVFSDSSIARARGDATAPYQPTYQHVGDALSGNASCAVYCHSNARGGPPNEPIPEWTGTKEFTCNSCHFAPPPSPHPPITSCWDCHTNVDPTSTYPNDIRFINDQLHVNGVVDL